MVSDSPPIRTGDPAHYSSTEDGGEVSTETLVATILRYDSRLTPEQARDLVEKFRELYRKTTEEKP